MPGPGGSPFLFSQQTARCEEEHDHKVAGADAASVDSLVRLADDMTAILLPCCAYAVASRVASLSEDLLVVGCRPCELSGLIYVPGDCSAMRVSLALLDAEAETTQRNLASQIPGP